jgi:hypothetical protein
LRLAILIGIVLTRDFVFLLPNKVYPLQCIRNVT